MYYQINEQAAATAKSMWSFREYTPGSTTEDYKNQVDYCYEVAHTAKVNTPTEKHEYIDYLCDKYAKKLAEYYNKSISIELMCPSVMISGGSNFPVRKKEKQNTARERNQTFYNDIKKIVDKIKSLQFGDAIIKSGDPKAIEMLQDKIDELEADQTRMKSANAHYKKYGTMKDFELLTDEEASRIDTKIESGYSWDKRPYPSYKLTNNNANIKNTKQRLERLVAVKEEGTKETETDLFKIVENTEIMRLQLLFDGKPDEKTRSVLKSNGFKWAPSQNAWQRQLTENAKYSLQRIIKELA
jgi:hypothetical protein